MRPGIVYVTLSAWGHEGPWRHRRGYDTVVQSANGFAYKSDKEKPAFLPVSAQDYVAGYLLAFGAMVALGRRAREGGSWLVRTSLAGAGHFIRQHGLVEPCRSTLSLPSELPPEEVAALVTEHDSPIGRLRTETRSSDVRDAALLVAAFRAEGLQPPRMARAGLRRDT